jgi:DNA-binding response OmpR family regulator
MSKILIIEDEKSIREDILEILNAAGYIAMGAEDGLTGLQAAQQQYPDLILCDLMLPGIGGIDVLRNIRQEQALSNTRFVFLSARTDQEVILQALNLGADFYLTKPIGLKELLEAVKKALSPNLI